MDRDFSLDLSEVMKSIENAEVMSIFFLRLRKSLIIDTRFTLEDKPMIKVVPMASSLEDRLRSLRKMRPNLPRPGDITLIPWFGYVDSLIDLGVWDRIMQRFVDSAQKDVVKECSNILKELRMLEQDEMAAVIKGEGYQTIWSSLKR